MDTLLQFVMTLSAVVVAFAATMVAIELRRTRYLLEEIVYRDYTTSPPPPDDGPGHAVFMCKDGQWILAADMSRRGYQASPPTMEPSYDGQIVKRTSISTADSH
jgi:hypothetical protein